MLCVLSCLVFEQSSPRGAGANIHRHPKPPWAELIHSERVTDREEQLMDLITNKVISNFVFWAKAIGPG
jgi:hypothetical protein